MSTETQTKIIDGYMYEVHQLGFRQGRRVLVRLVKALGPTLGNTLKGLEGGLDTSKLKVSEMKVEVAGRIFTELSEAISEEDLDFFCDIFGATSFVSVTKNDHTKRVPLDQEKQETHFKGAYESFFKWLFFCLEVNFAGFTKGLTNASGIVRS